ncbi:uncharacterized protein LOC107647559 [Arachis ipaensis]|uniref:uncharacterized protein LOC107647559 n=1 Tax=Arachis ipaensis TaxID=130454 RepID=UPI0007AF680C|nr:uncharacterized protein LOC107647559 [Arachis ipaensis]
MFTWFWRTDGFRKIAKRLDKVCSNGDWRLLFPEAYAEVLCHLHSDHCPLLVRCLEAPMKRGARPFRFQATWTSHPEYKPLIKKTWDGIFTAGCIQRSLNLIQSASLEFNSKVFGNIFANKRNLEFQLEAIQKRLEFSDDAELREKEEDLRAALNTILA